MKLIRNLILAIIFTLIIVGAQFVITYFLKINLYTYYLETYYAFTNFRYALHVQSIILLFASIFAVLVALTLIKKAKTLALISVIAIAVFNILPIIEQNKSHISLVDDYTNAIVMGSDAPTKMVLYARFTCKDCVALNAELSEVIEEYIDSHKLQLIVKLVDANSTVALSNTKITYAEYKGLYGKTNELKNINFDEYKSKLGAEYETRIKMAEANKNETKLVKVHWVPTFFINQHKYEGHFTKAQFKEIIEKEMKNGKQN